MKKKTSKENRFCMTYLEKVDSMLGRAIQQFGSNAAEDVCQEVSLKYWEALRRGIHIRTVDGAFVEGIFRHECAGTVRDLVKDRKVREAAERQLEEAA